MSILNYRNARKNMVECQLATNGINDPQVVRLFGALPREVFLPEQYRDRAYTDEDLVLPDGRVMVEPLVHARMLQALNPQPDDIALIIGDCTGYASAMLCPFVTTVLTLEPKVGMLDRARQTWLEIGACNIALTKGNEYDGCPDHAPYSLIVLHGAVTHVPDHLLDQLGPGGRLVAVVRRPEDNIGRITLISRDGDNNFSAVTMHDAATPYINGFKPQPVFRFG